IRRSSKSGSRFSRPRAIVFASSLISVEKNSAGPGVIEAPKKLDRCGVKHEIVALILTAIRASVRKRRKPQLLYTDSCNRLIVNGLERELPRLVLYYAIGCIRKALQLPHSRPSPRDLFL